MRGRVLIDKQVLINLVVASVSVVITNIFNYIFTLKKETRLQATKYKEEILIKVYTPIYKELIKQIYPGDGYEGISLSTFRDIEKIVEDNLTLVDPQLQLIISGIKEDIAYIGYCDSINSVIIDQDSKLFHYVFKQYNLLRKNLGLPYEKQYPKWIIRFKFKVRWLLKSIKRKQKIKKLGSKS
jgi:hypothetical protein